MNQRPAGARPGCGIGRRFEFGRASKPLFTDVVPALFADLLVLSQAAFFGPKVPIYSPLLASPQPPSPALHFNRSGQVSALLAIDLHIGPDWLSRRTVLQ